MRLYRWAFGLTLLVGAMSSPCLALDYMVPFDTPATASIVNRSDIQTLPNGDLQVHYMRIVNPASQIDGKQIHYWYILDAFDCRAHTFRLGSIYFLNDDFTIASISTAPNARLTDPHAPAPSSPVELTLNAVCAAGEASNWVHTDANFNDVVRLKLVAMGGQR